MNFKVCVNICPLIVFLPEAKMVNDLVLITTCELIWYFVKLFDLSLK